MRTEDLIFSSLLNSDQYARAVLPHIDPNYFQTESDKVFYKLYTRFFTKYNKIPSKQALLVDVENIKAAADLYNDVVGIINQTETFDESLEYLVNTTETFCKERAVYNALRESVLIVDGQDKKKTPESIPDILRAALAVGFDKTVGHDYISDADKRYEYYHTEEKKIPTGIKEFDIITKGGLPRKTLNFFLAPPHGGKTLCMVNAACGALLAGYNVLFISAEMSEFEITRRVDVNLMDIDFDTLEQLPKQIFESKVSSIAKNSMGRLIVKEYPTGTAHTGHIRALLEELKTKQNYRPDMIVIDYLGICISERYKAQAGANSYTIGKATSEEFRALAVEEDVAVLSAIQTNRTGIGNSELGMAEISESIGTAMTADFIAGIVNTDDLKNLKQIMFRIIKNRYTGIADNNKFVMGIDYNKMKLHSLDDSFLIAKDNKKKHPRIETANDTFKDANDEFGLDMLHTIKPTKASFDDFNF